MRVPFGVLGTFSSVVVRFWSFLEVALGMHEELGITNTVRRVGVLGRGVSSLFEGVSRVMALQRFRKEVKVSEFNAFGPEDLSAEVKTSGLRA